MAVCEQTVLNGGSLGRACCWHPILPARAGRAPGTVPAPSTRSPAPS